MMKGYSKNQVKCLVLIVVLCQLLNTFCTRKLFPEPSSGNIENQVPNQKIDVPAGNLNIAKPADKTKLEVFRNAPAEKVIDTKNVTAEGILETARKFLGVPHCMGGTTMRCIDCSGLIVTVFGIHGIKLPHNSQELAAYGKIIKGKENLIKGDLVFFKNSYKTDKYITHSGIYAGENKFIHTSSNNGVSIISMDDSWWRPRFVYGTRLLK